MADSFVHLHVHTEYSMLDGAATVEASCSSEVDRQGMPAVAMTDHGNMHGAYEFYHAAKKAGVKPIIGIEAYVAPESRYHKKPVFWGQARRPRRDGEGGDVSGGGLHPHDDVGGRTPTACTTCSGSPRAPRRGLLQQVAPDGQRADRRARRGDHRHHRLPVRRGADPAAARPVRRGAQGRRDVPGHLRQGELLPGADGPRPRHRAPGPRRPAARSARSSSIPPLVTNDSHYTYEDRGRRARRAAVRADRQEQLADPNRFQFDGTGYYLKTADEMRDAVRRAGRRAATTPCWSPSRSSDYGECSPTTT